MWSFKRGKQVILERTKSFKDYLLVKKINDFYWKTIFDQADTNNDGYISYHELKDLIKRNSTDENMLPENVIKQIHSLGDRDGNDRIDKNEFMKLLNSPQLQNIFPYEKFLGNFIVIPKVNNSHTDGSYEKSISCSPFPWFFVFMSLVQLGCYVYDSNEIGYSGNSTITNGPISKYLFYDHSKKVQVWRFFTYMFVHSDWFHLGFNILIQLLVGLPLEMVHKQWRVLTLFLGGILTASLWTTVIQPTTNLAGSSGGVYALMTAHVSALILNWNQMETAWIQVIVFILVVLLNVISQVNIRFILKEPIGNVGYTAHIFGALAGILLGLCILRNFEVKTWEKKMKYCSAVLYVMLIGSAIVYVIVR